MVESDTDAKALQEDLETLNTIYDAILANKRYTMTLRSGLEAV
jgi:hypothetical protein